MVRFLEENYTFSQLISLLIKLEEEFSDRCVEKADRIEDPQMKKALRDLARVHRERVDALKKTSRETVIEMALEPMSFPSLTSRLEEMRRLLNSSNLGRTLIDVEGMFENLYREVSSKIVRMSGDAALLLKSFSKESQRMCKVLDEILQKL